MKDKNKAIVVQRGIQFFPLHPLIFLKYIGTQNNFKQISHCSFHT